MSTASQEKTREEAADAAQRKQQEQLRTHMQS